MTEGKEIRKWADDAMFRSESHDASTGPRAHLISMTADPLGEIAACAKMYKGEVARSKADVTHKERKDYLREMQKTKLKMPLEAVQLHFLLDGVTRAFTHQLVRQRTAAYAQESMRFAVVEDMNEAVALPPSLAHFNERVDAPEWRHEPKRTLGDAVVEEFGHLLLGAGFYAPTPEYDRLPDDVKDYLEWRWAVAGVSAAYNRMIARGRMPAEDARGIMPTNITTRVHYITNLRALLDHAGNRLCTQAQFEWRSVFAQIAHAIRNYGEHDARIRSMVGDSLLADGLAYLDASDRWQYEAIADLLKPVCYQVGSCVFQADFDRKCSIRDRVQANSEIGRPSSEWDEEHDKVVGNPVVSGVGPQSVVRDEENRPVFIGAISPAEWLLDPKAAR